MTEQVYRQYQEAKEMIELECEFGDVTEEQRDELLSNLLAMYNGGSVEFTDCDLNDV